jgi:hypothetical protein
VNHARPSLNGGDMVKANALAVFREICVQLRQRINQGDVRLKVFIPNDGRW